MVVAGQSGSWGSASVVKTKFWTRGSPGGRIALLVTRESAGINGGLYGYSLSGVTCLLGGPIGVLLAGLGAVDRNNEIKISR